MSKEKLVNRDDRFREYLVKGDYQFDGIVCDLDSAFQDRKSDLKTKRLVVATFLTLAASSILVAGGYGMIFGDWRPLIVVWLVVVAPPAVIFKKFIGDFDYAKFWRKW